MEICWKQPICPMLKYQPTGYLQSQREKPISFAPVINLTLPHTRHHVPVCDATGTAQHRLRRILDKSVEPTFSQVVKPNF